MCGIAGYFGSNKISKFKISKTLNLMKNRGPDNFGLYKNGRAINPQRIISVTKTKLTGKKRKDFLKVVKKIKADLKKPSSEQPLKIEKFELSYKI